MKKRFAHSPLCSIFDKKDKQMKEVWKDVKGFEGIYAVSNKGDVKSYNYSNMGIEQLIHQEYTEKGYLRVDLYRNGKCKHYKVHRLVAETFLDNPDNLPCINHKDEDKTNNSVENLEWCTVKYNNNYGTAPKRRIEQRCKTVYQYTLDGEFVKEWQSANEIERELGFFSSYIRACCRGKHPTAYGYIWKDTN